MIGMKVVFYRDVRGEWRWKIVARNGRIVGASSEGFKRERAARRNLELVRNATREPHRDES
jgi:uncharacterized protein YegP (UPF0339 family)